MVKSSPSPALSGPSSGDGDERRKPPRKLHRSPNQLHRNQACLTCRRRRIKCDAGRPHCSSCVRSFRFLARRQPDPERDSRGVQCVYEHNEEAEEQDPRAAVAKLEARVAELQGELDRLTSRPSGSSTRASNSVNGFEMAPNGVNASEFDATNSLAVNGFDTAAKVYGPSCIQAQHHGQVMPLHSGNRHGHTRSLSVNEYRSPVVSHRSLEQSPALLSNTPPQIFQPIWPNPEQDRSQPQPPVYPQQQPHFPPTQYDASFPYGSSLPVPMPVSTGCQQAQAPSLSATSESPNWGGNTSPFHPIDGFDSFSTRVSDPVAMSQLLDTMGMGLGNNPDRRDSDQ